ncbi:MAG: hypothetical protein OEL77_00275 [Nitrosopumilus sp.]|nr:hypothetical protein [Nitrosopumilus sp.]MDH3384438.1 hypothetical protein [Nitrosopumilus sp.]
MSFKNNIQPEKLNKNIEDQILEFVQNRHDKNESTGPRQVHIRFDIEIIDAEEILETLAQKNKISKFYDMEYQEERYIPN